jgi:hypothetical protein
MSFLIVSVALVSIFSFLICEYLIHHKRIESELNKTRIGKVISKMSQVTIEVLVMITSGLITGFGTVLYWFHNRLRRVEKILRKVKISVTGSEDDVQIKGHDERIEEMEKSMKEYHTKQNEKMDKILDEINGDKIDESFDN